MERGRETKRAPRRLRISCPKDVADAEARMDDTPLIEKVKRANFQALITSYPSTGTFCSKRKHDGFQDAQTASEVINAGKEFLESTPYDDDFPLGTANNQSRAKKDELMMNICHIPRRARSFATRVPISLSRYSVLSSQQRSPSPRRFDINEEKLRRGMKSRLLKELEAKERSEISDDEVDVALLLFSLSRSLPGSVQPLRRKKSSRVSKKEEFHSRIHTVSSSSPLTYESKRKRRQVFETQEESLCTPSAGRVHAITGPYVSKPPQVIQVDRSEFKYNTSKKLSHEQSKNIMRGSVKDDSQFDAVNNKNATEKSDLERKQSEDLQTIFAEQICNQDGAGSFSKSERIDQILGKADHLKTVHWNEKNSDLSNTNSRQDMWSLSRNCSGKTTRAENELENREKAGQQLIEKDSNLGTDDFGKNKELAKAANRQQETVGLLDPKKENAALPNFGEGQETLSGLSSLSKFPSRESSSPMSMGWMGAFPQQSSNKKQVPSWLTNCLHSGSSLYQGLQFPVITSSHEAVKPMKRCATHIHIAHVIQQQQQFLRKAFVTPTLIPHDSNRSFTNTKGKENWSNKISSMQVVNSHICTASMGARIPISRGTGSGTRNDICTAGSSNSANIFSVGVGTKNQFVDSKCTTPATQAVGSGTVSPSLGNSFADNVAGSKDKLFSAHMPFQIAAQRASCLSHLSMCQLESSDRLLAQPHSIHPQAQPQQLQQQFLHSNALPQLNGAETDAFAEGNRFDFR